MKQPQISTRHFDFLALLVEHNSLTGTQMAGLLQTSPSSVTRAGARLETRGLVVRRIDPRDRRVIRWQATAAGRTLAKKITWRG